MPLNEKQKREAHISLLNTKATSLLIALEKILAEDPDLIDWQIDISKYRIFAPNQLKLVFELQDTAWEKRFQELDKNQQTLDEVFTIEEDSIQQEAKGQIEELIQEEKNIVEK